MEEKFRTVNPGGPREKMEAKGPKAMSDKELVMILLGKGTEGHPLEEVAGSVLGVLDRNVELTMADLKYIPGVGQAKAAAILSALELGRRKPEKKKKVLKTPQEIWQEMRHYGEREQEHLFAISFNGAGEVLGIHTATIGFVDQVMMHPREVFADAIHDRAVAVVIVHNHPAGTLFPSIEDKRVTIRIREAGRLLGINVLDHIIITKDGYYSFAEHGMMEG